MTDTHRSESAALAHTARQVMPGGVNSGQRVVAGLEDLVIVRAEGATFTDADGQTFCDYHAAFGPIILGHCDPDIDSAFFETARRTDLYGVGRTPEEIDLCQALVELIPSIESVVLTCTGSEATFHAIRLARAVTQKRLLIKFQGCYHGWHDAVALNVISPSERIGTYDPLSEGMMADTVESTAVLPFNDLAAVERYMSANGSDIAAIILEPIPHNVGALLPQDDFLIGLRRLCDRYGTILIFDEVITGFRHSLGGFQSIAGVQPDLTTLGKAMANGYPIGALGGRRDLIEEFSCIPGKPAFFAGTYNGHPGCAAAALATITKLRTEPVHEHIFRLGELARAELQTALTDVGTPTWTTGFGSVFVTYFLEGPTVTYDDLTRNDVGLFTGYRRKLLADGIFELPLNLKRSHISYSHTSGDVDKLVDRTTKAVKSVLEERARSTPRVPVA